MQGMYPNIYQRARKYAGITQEAAAEILNISVESIRAYETGIRRPTQDTLDLMARCYHTDWLYALHAREVSSGVQDILPDFMPGTGLSQAACDVIDKIYSFADRHSDRRLLAIAADNVITDDERREFDRIMEDLQDIVQAAIGLRYCNQGEGEG